MNNRNNLIYFVGIVLVLVGLGFGVYKIIGMSKKSSNDASNQQIEFGQGGQKQFGQNGMRGGPGGRGNFKPLSGMVSSILNNNIKMKTSDNSEKTISITGSTRISRMEDRSRTESTLSDISIGDTINVMADDTTGSTVSAKMIVVGEFSPPSGQRPQEDMPDSDSNESSNSNYYDTQGI